MKIGSICERRPEYVWGNHDAPGPPVSEHHDGSPEYLKTDDWFRWIKTESVDKLEKYVNDMLDNVTAKPITVE